MSEPRHVPIAEHEKVLEDLHKLQLEHSNLKMELSDAGGVGGLRAKITELQSQLELMAREKMKFEEENARLKERSLEDRIRSDRVIEVTSSVAASLQSSLKLSEALFTRLDQLATGQVPSRT